MTWPMVSLGEVAEINPRMPRTLDETDTASFLPMAAVSENGQVDYEEERQIGDVKKGYTYFARNDVLLAKITPCFENGKAAVADNLKHPVGFGSTEFHVVRGTDRLHPQYAFHLLWGPNFRELGTKNMTGSAGQKRVPKGLLERLQIPLPPLDEQKRIAGILDQADALRRKRRDALALLDTLTQSIFVEMFGDLIEGAKVHDSTKRTAKKEWQHCKLGDQITLQRGKDITKKGSTPGDVPVISSGGTSFFHNEALVKGPGVLLGRKGSVGKVHFSGVDFWPHDTTLYVRDFKGNNPTFIYHFFKKFPISRYEASAANPSLNRNNLHPVELIWPSLQLQQTFASLMERVDNMREKANPNLQTLDSLFASLQSRAFSGKL